MARERSEVGLGSGRKRNPPAPAPTPHVGPFVMSVEFPTPKADEPTHRIPYEEVATIEEAVTWICRPPFPPETLKKLKKGVLLTARMQAEWVQENGQRGEEIAAMGLVLRVGTRNVPTKIAVVTHDGISVDGEQVSVDVLGLTVRSTNDIMVWLEQRSTAEELLESCAAVPRPLLALTACSLLRSILSTSPTNDGLCEKAILAIESWSHDVSSKPDILSIRTSLRDISSWLSTGAIRAISIVLAVTDGGAAWAAASVATAVGHADASHRASQAEIVRSWIGMPNVAFAVITRKK